jgi:hypothetical protein
MLTTHKPSTSFKSLASEQRWDQCNKRQHRRIGEYERLMYSGFSKTAFADEMRKLTGKSEEDKKPSLIEIIEALVQKFGECRWLDVGCGFSLPQREFKLRGLDESKGIQLISLDLIDWSLHPSFVRQKDTYSSFKHLMDPKLKPQLILSDAATFRSRKPFHLITGIETLQYQDDKLKTLCHLYNQLVDEGYLLISSGEGRWATNLRSEEDPFVEKMALDLGQQLRSEKIPWYGAQRLKKESTSLGDHFSVLFKKSPKTRIFPRARLSKIRKEALGYKVTEYSYSHNLPLRIQMLK